MKSALLPLSAMAAIFAVSSTPAQAKLPEPVRAMLDAAIANGDAAKVETVAELAKQTNPTDAAEVDALMAGFRKDQARIAKAEAKAKEKAIRSAGLFDRWKGAGELGAYLNTGNSDDRGVTAGLKLSREGIDWQHVLKGKVNVKSSNGQTTSEQFLFSYQPRYTINDGLYTYGLGEFERDRFQGFASRIALSAGVGYRAIDSDSMKLSLEAGPAWRRTDYTPGAVENALAARLAADFNWKIADHVTLVEEASAYYEDNNSTLTSLTGVDFGINGNLKARLSYLVEYDSDPGVGAVNTDTTSRVTLIYDF